MPQDLKRKVYEHCALLLAERLQERRAALNELINAAANETKSTAGDKYETSRAMLHIEQDNVRRQLSELSARKAVLDRINITSYFGRAQPGSLVKTSKGYFFLSIALGKFLVDSEEIIALSAASPLGRKLIGRSVGEAIIINGNEAVIELLL